MIMRLCQRDMWSRYACMLHVRMCVCTTRSCDYAGAICGVDSVVEVMERVHVCMYVCYMYECVYVCVMYDHGIIMQARYAS